MKNIKVLFPTLVLLLLCIGIACTPKTAPEVVEVKEVKQAPVVPEKEGCPNWAGKKFQQSAMENHVLYRQELELKNYEIALEYWNKVFSIAPAADGKRDYQYTDGMKIYKGLLATEKDEAKKEEYIKAIFQLYEDGMQCYPAKATMYKGLKAYDLFYTFPGRKSSDEIYTIFKDVIDVKGDQTAAFIINPFTGLLVNGLLEEKVSMADAQKYTKKIYGALDRATKELKDKNDPKWITQGWDVVEGYAPSRLEQLEGIDDFYDCEYYKKKYYTDFEAAPTDCDAILSTLGRLKRGNCLDADAAIVALRAAKDASCKRPPPASTCTGDARTALEEGRYKDAIGHYEDCISKSKDNGKKSLYALTIAKIYYAHLKSYSKSRQAARRAINFKPNNGSAYILIGKLYASSGTLCGPGRGWDSQIITWPAIDKWKKAKRVDSSVAKEANKLIARYQAFMPSKEDVFQKLMKDGDPFTVGCWIQEKTTVRAAK
ncbi:MAG: tetratricopeptide (TPR) repeat protein [Patescibacteria group bacterium]|jgi:tetratricopeptide (TPR) repeat protein